MYLSVAINIITKEKTMSEKFCYNCRFYKPYYTKGNIHFDKLDIGLCKQTNTTIEKHNHACGFFQCTYYARLSKKEAALSALTQNLNAIAEIKQILEEDDEEILEAFLFERSLQKRKKRAMKQKGNLT